VSKIAVRHLLFAVTAAVAGACSSAPAARPLASPAPNHFPPDCVAAGARGARRDSIRVVSDAPVSRPDAPVPRSGAERIAFALAYETLERVDCQGNATPGLATLRRGNGEVAFRLRPDARFWDGAPVTAGDVLASWRARDSALAARARAIGDSVVVVDGSAGDPVPAVAAPLAAVTKPAPDGGWPIGTGARWITDGGEAETIVQPVLPGSAPRIRFVPGTEDARDAIDGNADVVITDDRAALAYAARRPRLAVLPFAWSAVYVLVAPDEVTPDRGDLAGAVRVDAVPAESPPCPPARSRTARFSGPRRVAYLAGDATAEALAARLIGSGTLGPGVFAAALPRGEWNSALAQGTEWAVLERRDAGRDCASGSWGWSTPLIAVRSSAIVDRSLLPVTLTADGAPLLGASP